jgi:hypothetical protein
MKISPHLFCSFSFFESSSKACAAELPNQTLPITLKTPYFNIMDFS